MEELSEKEIQQLQMLDRFRKQIQLILKDHILLLSIAFVLFLAGVMAFIYMRVTRSPRRYAARVSLHYYPKQPGKIRPYEEKFLLQLFNRPALKVKFNTAAENREFDNMRPTGPIAVKVEKKRNSSFIITDFKSGLCLLNIIKNQIYIPDNKVVNFCICINVIQAV